MKQQTLLFDRALVNGQWMRAESGQTFDVINPANGEILQSLPDMGVVDTRSAIDAAHRVQADWAGLGTRERADVLYKWYDLIHANTEHLARIATLECGKPLSEAKGEVGFAASFVRWFAEEGRRVYGDILPRIAPDRELIVLKQPIGVCAAITPWNFPLAMITRKVAPGLAVGCTFVVKPAEATPLSALALGMLALEAGVPAGVLNIVTAAHGRDVGQEMCDNPLVRKLSFTGSTATGKTLLHQCAGTVKRVSMELGGNAPFIVFDDADLNAAVQGAMASKYRNTGQTCVCANRLLIQNGVYAEFSERLRDAVQQLKVGNGCDDGVTQGPLISQAGLDKVEAHVADAVDQGAQVLCGGQRHALGRTFYQPTVLTEVRPDMRIAREETFGPVAPLFRFDTEDEAIAHANDTESGLACYFYTRDYARVLRLVNKLDYGIVGVNEGITATETAPFGGVKQSGIGREGSKYGIDEYLEIKYACLGGLSPV